MENTPEKSWAKTMLELDLEMQSGAIWTDEKSQLQKEQKSDPEDENPFPLNESDDDDDDNCYVKSDGTRINLENMYSPGILRPNPVYYNGREILARVRLIK